MKKCRRATRTAKKEIRQARLRQHGCKQAHAIVANVASIKIERTQSRLRQPSHKLLNPVIAKFPVCPRSGSCNVSQSSQCARACAHYRRASIHVKFSSCCWLLMPSSTARKSAMLGWTEVEWSAAECETTTPRHRPRALHNCSKQMFYKLVQLRVT